MFATALLHILRPDLKITRGFVVPDDFDGIVYDVGFGMFDHHQEPREYLSLIHIFRQNSKISRRNCFQFSTAGHRKQLRREILEF